MLPVQNNEALAREFWNGTALGTVFPRDIEKAVALKVSLALVKLPRVTVPLVRMWLQERHLRACVPNDGRDLMGCLVAYRGLGIAFIAGADSAEEQRLTIAHETAHFLRDYFLPRRELLTELGDEVADVLDGKRAPRSSERAKAVLTHVRLGPHVHLMPRDGRDEESDAAVAASEDRADALGLELVAPRVRILSIVRTASKANSTPEDICTGLGERFGLPPHVFRRFVEPQEQHQIVSFL